MNPSPPLTHRVEGDGPRVVILNGGMMTFLAWESLAARLRARFQVLRFDFSGQLMSPGEDPHDLAGHARDLAALLDHLGWESAHLVGASFGGEVALELAATSPERVRSLIVITAMDRETAAFRRGSDETRELLADVKAGGDRGRFYDALVESIYSAGYRERESATLAARRSQMDQLPPYWFEGVDRLLAAMHDFDLGPRLTAIHCPVLAVLAAADRIMDEERSRAMATALSAEVVVHPTAGHGLVAEDPEWLANVCLAFLDRQEGGAS